MKYYIMAKHEDSPWGTHNYDGYVEKEDAEYVVECLKEVDEMNSESWEYKIVEIDD